MLGIVVSPRSHRAVFRQCQCMPATCGDCGDSRQIVRYLARGRVAPGSDPTVSGQRDTVGLTSCDCRYFGEPDGYIALPASIVAPRDYSAVLRQCEAVPGARGNGADAGEPGRYGALSIIIITPSCDGAFPCEREAMPVSRCDGQHIGKPAGDRVPLLVLLRSIPLSALTLFFGSFTGPFDLAPQCVGAAKSCNFGIIPQ